MARVVTTAPVVLIASSAFTIWTLLNTREQFRRAELPPLTRQMMEKNRRFLWGAAVVMPVLAVMLVVAEVLT